MSYEQVTTYLDFLEDKGLIERYESNGRVTYRTTEKGMNLRVRIEGLVKELGLDERPEETA